MSGGRNSTIGASKLAETHSVNGPKIDKHSNRNSQALGKHGFSQDSSKKSLSFFPDGDYSDQSSDASGGLAPESYKSLNCQHQNFKEDKFSTRNDELGKIEIENAVQVEPSHDNDASSTSSCSCEEHSSAASQTGEDPHGDLDYDDDDDNLDDEKSNAALSGNPRGASNISSLRETVGLQSPGKSSNDLQAQVEIYPPTSDEKDTVKIKAEVTNNQKDNSGDAELRANGTSKKITSFINFDHRHDDAIASDGLPITSGVKKTPKDRSHKSYKGLLRYFFKDACYFQIKSINRDNVELSKSMGVWSTPVQNEIRLNAAFRDHKNVILIFSVQQSGAFQGFARIVSESRPPQEPIHWILPERLRNSALGGVFRLEWLCTKELNFNDTRDLYNPYNNNKPIKVARDGQQVEPKVGKKLCSLFPKDSKKRLLASVETLKDQSRQRREMLKESSYYPLDDPRTRNGLVRRPRNGMLSRLDSSVPNGFSEATSVGRGFDQFYTGIVTPYGPMTQCVSNSVDFAQRGGLMNQMIPTGHIHRPRLYPNQGVDSYQRPTLQNHRVPMLDAIHHEGNEQYYHGPRGPDGNQYLNLMQRHAVLERYPRAYDDWTTAATHNHLPYRYHPYQRPKR